MTEKCFVCGKERVESYDHLERSPFPKELMAPNEAGDLAEDLQPICRDCNDFRKIVDSHFITFCEDAKLWEWYRSKSKKRGEYYPPTFIYNIPIETLKELYELIKEIALEAYKKSEDKQAREDIEDSLNYAWRKKDE